MQMNPQNFPHSSHCKTDNDNNTVCRSQGCLPRDTHSNTWIMNTLNLLHHCWKLLWTN